MEEPIALCFLFYLLASLPQTVTISSLKKITLEKVVNFFTFFTILSFLATLPQSNNKSLYYNK